jgi:hypothetical protein
VTFGALSNFDVFNDTGQVTHGFEIELDGISPSQVVYEFGAPYERYGNPTLVATSTGTNVIYASSYDPASKTFTAGTPLAPNPITPTLGHACWTGGSATYPTAGCEHFGLSLTGTPTNVTYKWLIADPVHAGQLMPAAGGVPLPAPILSVSPAPPLAVNQLPIVHAVAQAPEPDLGEMLGDAVWVKVWVAQSAKPADLGRLQTGDAESPSGASQVETDWQLIQKGVGGGLPVDQTEQSQVQVGKDSVVRRFEFYKYTGPYDPSSHEATPINDSAPSAGEKGNLIGVQMVALNLAKAGVLPGDHTAPVTRFTKVPTLTTTLHSATFTYAATDRDSPLFTWYCKLDRAIPSKCLASKTLSALKAGKHTFKVWASDPARNASKGMSWTWTIK